MSENLKFLLVFDANILIRDFWWQGKAFRFLETHFFLGHTPVIPEIALQEARANLVRRATESVEKLQVTPDDERKVAEFRRLFPSDTDRIAKDPEELGKRYESRIRARLRKHGGFVAKTPDVNLKTIVRRSVARVKPFNPSDKGFRDTLLWFTVLDLIRKHQHVSLVTGNEKDFGDGKGGFHPSLADEITAHLPQDKHANLFLSAEEFIAVFHKDGTVVADALRCALIAGKFKGFRLRKWLLRKLPKFPLGCELDAIRWSGLSESLEGPMLHSVEDLVAVDMHAAEYLEGGRVRLFCRLALIGRYTCAIYWDDHTEVVEPLQVMGVREDPSLPVTDVLVRAAATYSCCFDIHLESAKAKLIAVVPIEHDYATADEELRDAATGDDDVPEDS